MGPWLALDPGKKWIGVARRDPLGITLTPLPPIAVREFPPIELLKLIETGGYERVIIGLARGSEIMKTFATALETAIRDHFPALPIFHQCERHSTADAVALLRERGESPDNIKKWKDSFAAFLILQWYCEDHA